MVNWNIVFLLWLNYFIHTFWKNLLSKAVRDTLLLIFRLFIFLQIIELSPFDLFFFFRVSWFADCFVNFSLDTWLQRICKINKHTTTCVIFQMLKNILIVIPKIWFTMLFWNTEPCKPPSTLTKKVFESEMTRHVK